MNRTLSMNFINYLIAIIIIAAAGVSGCYPMEEFADQPENLETKQQAFEKVAEILKSMENTDEATAVGYATSNDKRVRRAAALRLKNMSASSPAAVKALTALVENDAEPRVRSAAVRALGEVTGNPSGVAAVINAICDDHPNVRLYALKSLFRMDASANPTILSFLASSKAAQKHCPTNSDANYTLEKELSTQLQSQGSRFLSLYITGLSHPSTKVVLASLQQIRKTGRSASAALPPMLELMKNAPEAVQYSVIQTFMTVGDQHPLVMPALYEAMSSSSPKISSAAKNAIQQIQNQHAAANQQNPKKGGPKGHPRPTRK
ncbi:MAG: HEAT repeat domain-containing protein [Deltaproteobacteria bacterium]|nr:HEAT repeat domain-containing protein [Deltaproteobacteria bacterium]